jgi:hypothetical protein
MITNTNVNARSFGQEGFTTQGSMRAADLSQVSASEPGCCTCSDGRTDCTVLTLYFPLQKHPQTSHGTIHLRDLVPLCILQDLAIRMPFAEIGGNQKTLRQRYRQSNDINQAVATVVAVMNTYVTFKHCLSVLQ